MPKFTQENRSLEITTPLGKDVLLLERCVGTEYLSALFSFRVDLLADASTTIAFDQVLGQSVTVQVRRKEKDLPIRYFNGIVSRFSQGHRIRPDDQTALLTRYEAEIVPKFWLLTHNVQSRIFQQITVPDILKQVLSTLDVSWEIQGTFDQRDYCTQYRESDFAFASRLMEEEGIYYFFKHADGSHTMVVANTPQSHPVIPGGTSSLRFEEASRGGRDMECITAWVKSQEIRSGKSTLWDHCFEMPDNNLQSQQTILSSAALGTVTHQLTAGGNSALELYDYPGRYAQRYDGVTPGGGDRSSDLSKIFPDGTRTVGIRMQEEATPALRVDAKSDVRLLTAGHKFTLTNHFDADGAFILTQVEHFASIEGSYFTGARDAYDYHNDFACIPLALPFRPPRVTPQATVDGTQVAVVVGPPGEEIFTDKYSRVKVQFYWDRLGKKDQNSSCWIRVGTQWASKQWGTIHIPRIGMEVIVAFEEGDPDQPIIVGCVYNADNMPPYTLPDNKTQSGVKSRSTLKGDDQHFNELRFEDKINAEDIYFHAQKDFHRYVEHDDDLKVMNDQTIYIEHNRTEEIKDGNETLTIDKGNRVELLKLGNDSLTLDQGNRTELLKMGNDSLTLQQGNRSIVLSQGNHSLNVTGNQDITITNNRTIAVSQGNEATTVSMGNQTDTVSLGNKSTTVSMGNYSLDVALGNISVNADAGSITVMAMQSITLMVGANSIKIDQTGITLNGIMIQVQGQAMIKESAPMIQINASGMLQTQGPMTMINASGLLILKGSLTMIN